MNELPLCDLCPRRASRVHVTIACLVICRLKMQRGSSIGDGPVIILAFQLQPKAPKVKCPHCLEEINKGATRCKWCTSEVDEENVLPAPNMGKEVPAKPVSKKDEVTPLR